MESFNFLPSASFNEDPLDVVFLALSHAVVLRGRGYLLTSLYVCMHAFLTNVERSVLI